MRKIHARLNKNKLVALRVRSVTKFEAKIVNLSLLRENAHETFLTISLLRLIRIYIVDSNKK